MELKPGYKLTEVGVIPEDWRVMPISSLCDIISGGTPSTSFSAFWLNGDIPWCTPSDITETNGKYIYRTDRNITSLGLAKSSANLLPEGSLLLCSRATIGEVKIAKTEIATNQGFKSLVCNYVDNEFMYYKVLTLKDKLLQFSIGSTFLEFSKKDIEKLQIDIPQPEEQTAIATVLSDMDALLDSLDCLIAKKRDIKQAAMQELLTGKTRLPGFEGEWEVKRLGDIANIQRGASPRPIDSPVWFDRNSTVGWVRIADITNAGRFLNETTQRLSSLGVKESRPVAAGSLIMSICATVGRPIITNIDVCIHDGFVVFGKLETDQMFIYYVLKWIEPDWSKHGQTGSQMNLNTGLINGTKIKLPSLSEQTAIAKVLSDMDAEIEALEERRTKTQNIKQGMMQELLTGKTRLIAQEG